jgi:integrase
MMKKFTEACDLYLAIKQGEDRLSLDTNTKVDFFRDTFGNLDIPNVTNDVIATRTAKRFAKLKPNSRRRWLNILSAIMQLAGDTWGIAVPRVKRPTVDDAREIHFDSHVVPLFLDAIEASPYTFYTPHFTTLVHTGVRLGELLRVQVSDLTSGELKVQKQGKFGKTVYRQIPLSSRMQSIIPLLPDWGYAFLKAKGKPFKSAHEASILFNSIMRSICGQMKHEVLRVHDLRHTFAFIAAQNGADIGDLQLLMGHKDISQTMRYRGFVPSRAINAVASL